MPGIRPRALFSRSVFMSEPPRGRLYLGNKTAICSLSHTLGDWSAETYTERWGNYSPCDQRVDVKSLCTSDVCFQRLCHVGRVSLARVALVPWWLVAVQATSRIMLSGRTRNKVQIHRAARKRVSRRRFLRRLTAFPSLRLTAEPLSPPHPHPRAPPPPDLLTAGLTNTAEMMPVHHLSISVNN